MYTQKFEPNFTLKHIFPRKLKNIKNKTITVETPHQIKHNTAQEQHQINKITTCNLKKKKKKTATQIKIHRRSPPLPKTQQPTNRESLSPFTTATQANNDERERERRGSPGCDEREIGVARLRRHLRVASLASPLPHGGLYSLHCLLCHASHIG